MSSTTRNAASTVYLRQYAVVLDSEMPWETGNRRFVMDFRSDMPELKSEAQYGWDASHGWTFLGSNGDSSCLLMFSKLAARRPALPRFKRSYPWIV